MKKKDLDKFKKILLEKRKKILQHLEELSETAEDDLESGNILAGDPVDQASMEINQASLQKIGKREKTLLKKIDLALTKVEDGSYGTCENCGEDIGLGRLEARPEAQLCIDCKTEQESMERRYSTGEVQPGGGDDDLFEGGDEE